MINKIKNKFLIAFTAAAAGLFLAPTAVLAGTPPPPPTPEIKRSVCAGSGVRITADPANDACDATSGSEQTANRLVRTIVNLLSIIIAAIAVIMIMIAGFRYVTSGGNQETIKNARNTLLYAIIGLVIVAFAQLIVRFVLAQTDDASSPKCVAVGSGHKWDSGPNYNKSCTP